MPPADALEKHSNCAYFSVAEPDSDVRFEREADGTGVIHGLRVFREGTFRDSLGEQHTWESTHLEQMVFHFNLLKDNGVFPNVPQREGHPRLFGSSGQVVGYFVALRHEGEFLVADIRLTEPDAVGKWERKTYRARSLEVGMYETNDEALYWPVVMGCAFVDIPAVEGLYARARQHNAAVVTVDQEATVPDQPTPAAPAAPAPAAPAPAAPAQPQPPAQPAAAGASPSHPAPGGDPADQHGSNPGTLAFRVNGRPTGDPAAVQRHIDALEAFQSATKEANRKAFVEALAKDGRIGQPQVEGLTSHALDLTDEQFEGFKKGYENAPKLSIFENHGGSPPNPDGQAQPNDEVDILEETVKQLRHSGMTDEQVQKTQAFQRLQALRAAK